ncbi:MAG TPA: C-GCAxxG-C-C family protein [Clostridia bacterium]|nr:C-GCAxxG-C-C family protein [Clostridia bacterium]
MNENLEKQNQTEVDYEKKALENFKKGYNCAQSVTLAFADKLNVDSDTALKISSSFGGGVGRMREICGALSGAYIVMGMLNGYSDPIDDETKTNLYISVQSFAEKFKKENGSLLCRDLLGVQYEPISPIPEKRTEKYYHNRSCEKFVGHSAKLLADYIKNMEETKK